MNLLQENTPSEDYIDPLTQSTTTEEIVEERNDEEEQKEELPIEYQLEKVDMNDEDMDMLEWLVRRWIPIPKEYYWETGNEDLPLKIKAWHRIVGSLSGAVKTIERIGQPVTEAVRSTSRFDYVRDSMTEKQMEIAMKIASERKLRNEASLRSLQVEEGALE